MRSFAVVLAGLLASIIHVHAHGSMTKVQVKRTQQTACSVHSRDPECRPSPGVSLRSVISRTAGQPCADSSSGMCSNERGGCCAIPGDPTEYNCDHCALERVMYSADALTNSKWWTDLPAIYWDLPAVAPTRSCMSNDNFGDRGTLAVQPGDVLSTAWYVNADHSGLYRFELSCGENAREADFIANALTPWKALHRSKELGGNDTPLPVSRNVGSTRAETDAYYRRTICTGTGCDGQGVGLWNGKRHMNPSNEEIDSIYCRNNRDSCFIEDEFVIPSETKCRGSATLRWKWNSAEGKEIYAACVDLKVDGAGSSVKPQPPTSPQPQPGDCTKANIDMWGTGSEIPCCAGLNQCLEDRSPDSPIFDKHPEVIMCRSRACGPSKQPVTDHPVADHVPCTGCAASSSGFCKGGASGDGCWPYSDAVAKICPAGTSPCFSNPNPNPGPDEQQQPNADSSIANGAASWHDKSRANCKVLALMLCSVSAYLFR